MRMEQASVILNSQDLELPLGSALCSPPLVCQGHDAIEKALRLMHEHRSGSVQVINDRGAPIGILTRFDVVGRITLAGMGLSEPISRVMTTPVESLPAEATAADAAILMTRMGIRHVPVTLEGRLVGVVTERDLFARQQMSINHLHSAIRAARTAEDFRAAAADVRQLAAGLLALGVQAQPLTDLISHLNDVLTRQLVAVKAQAHARNMDQACWLAFGSEGRSEQTVATDQDNGLAFVSEEPSRDREGWLNFAQDVNQSLADCGFPLCKGRIMAGNPACCLSVQEWIHRLDNLIEQGSPQDLLAASIFFDLRPIAGRLSLAGPLRETITRRAKDNPRFCRQLAQEVLRVPAALGLLGGIHTHTVDGVPMLDIKLHGTAVFVAVARLRSLALGIGEVNTCRRLEAVARLKGVPAQHAQAWIAGFEFLQMLRLRSQLNPQDHHTPSAGPNHIRVDALHDMDHRMLKESLRAARELQWEVELDYCAG